MEDSEFLDPNVATEGTEDIEQDDSKAEQNEQQKIRSSNLQQVVMFISPSLVRISGRDFTLNDPRIPIGLEDMSCSIILFYINNTESRNMGAIFAEVAETAAGIKFAAINMRIEDDIARAFVKVKASPASPVHWAGLKQYPFILVYREGLPTASYNGERSVGAMTNWALTLACRFDYTEMAQEFGGAQIENNIEMSGVRTYSEAFKEGSTKTASTEFKANEDIRGYDPSKGVRLVSRSEMKEVGDEGEGLSGRDLLEKDAVEVSEQEKGRKLTDDERGDIRKEIESLSDEEVEQLSGEGDGGEESKEPVVRGGGGLNVPSSEKLQTFA